MDVEQLQTLVGKYLNGYKIIKIERDPFIKGQINLFTNQWGDIGFGDRKLVKFFIRNEGNTAAVYQEIIDKEIYELRQTLIKIRTIILENYNKYYIYDDSLKSPQDQILAIIDEL